MTVFSLFIMLMGFMSVLIAGTFADFAVTRATIWGIFGSILFGSGFIFHGHHTSVRKETMKKISICKQNA